MFSRTLTEISHLCHYPADKIGNLSLLIADKIWHEFEQLIQSQPDLELPLPILQLEAPFKISEVNNCYRVGRMPEVKGRESVPPTH